jgi:hypothetical protein
VLLELLAQQRETLDEVFQEAGLLRALAGEEEGELALLDGHRSHRREGAGGDLGELADQLVARGGEEGDAAVEALTRRERARDVRGRELVLADFFGELGRVRLQQRVVRRREKEQLRNPFSLRRGEKVARSAG